MGKDEYSSTVGVVPWIGDCRPVPFVGEQASRTARMTVSPRITMVTRCDRREIRGTSFGFVISFPQREEDKSIFFQGWQIS
jgi:hypothetical protein